MVRRCSCSVLDATQRALPTPWVKGRLGSAPNSRSSSIAWRGTDDDVTWHRKYCTLIFLWLCLSVCLSLPVSLCFFLSSSPSLPVSLFVSLPLSLSLSLSPIPSSLPVSLSLILSLSIIVIGSYLFSFWKQLKYTFIISLWHSTDKDHVSTCWNC